MAELYEQQPKESAKAFAAFSVYLNLGRRFGKSPSKVRG
jgi:hypothetical protein